MKELLTLTIAARRLRDASSPFALATVVKVMGSAYRRPGARMLIAPDGTPTGTISGGCLEGEVVQQALRVLDTGTPLVLPFELGEDDHIMGFGTGCGGDVHVLIEPVPNGDHADPVDLLETCLNSRDMALMATVIDAPLTSTLGRRLVVLADRSTRDDIAMLSIAAPVHAVASETPPDQPPTICSFPTPEGLYEVLFESIRPPVHLVLFGDGPDVDPVVRLAQPLGWRVTVVGRKTRDELQARFPEAHEHVFLMHADEVDSYVSLDCWSAAVVMTHNFLRDQALLPALLASPARYVGVLGPKHRTERLLDALEAGGRPLDEAERARLYGPVGLDIGTETPEEIALSILAEIQAVFHHRSGGLLREREGAIHRVAE